ncbi:MAG: DinB family protein, partial [Actinomycetota bacterium]
MAPSAPGLQTFYDGWANHHRLVRAAIRELTSEQLALWTAPHQWSVWQLAGHMAGSRSYWFHDV